MDVKDSRTESGLSERNNEGSKYTQGGVAIHCNRNKSYQDIGSIPMAKADQAPVRPCAVIGPDRVVPPPASNDAFLKKGSVEPWPSPDNLYRRPPEYPHKILSNQNPSRNISPRQTFQENMQRISVPPIYNAARHSDEGTFSHDIRVHDRSAIAKNVKPNVAPEVKYCDVPYAINSLTSESKTVREAEMYVPSVNSPLVRTAPPNWPTSSVNMQAPRAYGAHELYQYPQYPSCAGQRPTLIPMTRPHRTIQEDTGYVYPDHYYQDANARFKPYLPVRERYPQTRYEYMANYPSHQFHPPATLQSHKYDIPKSGLPHPYPGYPHLKYLDSRVSDHSMEGYQRPSMQTHHYNVQFQNQAIHPTFAPVSGNSSQNKLHPYSVDGSVKTASNKLRNDNSKMYIDYENVRNKTYPIGDSYFANEMSRVHPAKNQIVMPNYSSLGVHSIPTQQYYRKDNAHIKPFEYMPHFRNFEHPLNSNPMMRHAPQFSPNTLAISPSDSNTSNDTSLTHGTSQEDCGYVSQSSTASVRSIDSNIYRIPNDYYKRYGPFAGSSPTVTRSDSSSDSVNSKECKQNQINVRQFLQMWNEGEDENSDNNVTKEIVVQTGSSDTNNYQKHQVHNQDQLYVLGLVNVPREELSKYEHIQKISKLPENIKGYNNLELLSQFEEAIESSNSLSCKPNLKDYQMPLKDNIPKQVTTRPLSPLDVEAKISQSVIHKEVRCNFEIRPCSPKMLNAEIASPVQNLLGERVIEKVTNPLSKTIKSPMPMTLDENSNCHAIKKQDNAFSIKNNSSCKMISPYDTNNLDSVKMNYSLQDLEINSGVCLASLPRLDNEIELNFLEVNQQFINANKIDSSNMMQNNCPGIISKEKQANTDTKFIKKNIDLSEKGLLTDESGKKITKLSKFRKLKTALSNPSAKIVRTDSVIIKNPENIKNIEDKLMANSHNIPINLSSQLLVSHETCDLTLPNKLNESVDNDVNIALDFSLNKSGTDLPIIDIENTDSTRPLSIKLADLSPQNLSHTDSSQKTNIESPPEHATCIENNQNAQKNSSDNIVEESSKSVVNSSHTNSCEASGDNSTVNEYLNANYDVGCAKTDYDKDIPLKICQEYDAVIPKDEPVVKECDSQISSMISKDNVCEDQNIAGDFINSTETAPSDLVSSYEESTEMMQLLNTENGNTDFVNDSENDLSRYKDELSPSSQKKDDFENDEISAKLEQLFQESNENYNKPFTKSYNSHLNESAVTPVQTVSYHQSKELYSPRIQNLLTNTEGLCRYNITESTKKESIRFTQKNEIYFNNKVFYDTRFEKESCVNKQETDHNKQITSLLDETIDSKIFIKESLDVSMSATKCKNEPEANTNISATIEHRNNYQDISDNKSLNIIKPLILEENNIINKEKFCSENCQTNVNVITTCETIELSEVTSSKNEIVHTSDISIQKTELSETSYTEKYVPEAKIQGNASIQCIGFCNFQPSNSEEPNDQKSQKDSIIENVSTSNTCVGSEISPDCNIALELDSGVLSSNCPSSLSLSKCVEIEDYSRHETLETRYIIENEGMGSNIKKDDPSETFEIKAIIGKKNKNNNLLHLLNAFDDDNEDKIKNNQNVCNLNENVLNSLAMITDTPSTPNQFNNSSFESSCNTNSDNCTAYRRVEKLNMDKIPGSENCHNNISSDNIKDVLVNVASESLINLSTISYNSISNSTGQETKEKSIGQTVADESMNTVDAGLGTKVICDFVSGDENDKKCPKTKIDKNTFVNRAWRKSVTDHSDKETCNGKIDCKCDDIIQEELNIPCTERDSVSYAAVKALDCNNVLCGEENVVEGISNIRSIECFIKKDDCKTVAHSFDSTKTVNNKGIVLSLKNLDVAERLDVVSDEYSTSQTDENVNDRMLIIKSDSERSKILDGDNIVHQSDDNIKMILNSPVEGNVCNNSGNSGPISISYVMHQPEDYQNSRRTVELNQSCEVAGEASETLNCKNVTFDRYDNMDNLFSNQKEENKNALSSSEENVAKICENATSETTKARDSGDVVYEVNDKVNNDDNINQEPGIKHLAKTDPDYCIERKPDINHGTEIVNVNDNLVNFLSKTFQSCNSEFNQSDFKKDKKMIRLRNIPDSTSDELYGHKKDRDIFVHDNRNHMYPENISLNSILESKALHIPDYSNGLLENDTEDLLKDRDYDINNKKINAEASPKRRVYPLKRSYSDSALHDHKYKNAVNSQFIENTPAIWPAKRQRMYDIEQSDRHAVDENLCNIIQSNRRNSVSAFYNEGNVSFCILIDNDCIITEENEEDKICFAEISGDCITEINTMNEEDNGSEMIRCSQQSEIHISESVLLDYENERSFENSWLDDVACVETVVSDDIEDVAVSEHNSPIDVDLSKPIESTVINCEHANGVRFTDEENVFFPISQVEETHITVDEVACVKSGYTEDCDNCLDAYEYLDKSLLESNSGECSRNTNQEPISLILDDVSSKMPEDKENISIQNITEQQMCINGNNLGNIENNFNADVNQTGPLSCVSREYAKKIFEPSLNNAVNHRESDEDVNYTTSSSPEVSSTTSEEKSSSILLKITNYNGSRVSEINEVNHNRPRCKFTEVKDYSNSHGIYPKRPLLTKAAQKYIPPIKETIRDLKVKLTLPHQRLLKLKQLKLSRSEPKASKLSNTILTIPKKSKPNFEDVLKSIDEIQIKMHKEKSKRPKSVIPKVVIKKNVNGSHYTSSMNKDTFNPDMTGRKWQPWVFLEKNHFIDQMVIRNKTKAIYNHRKNAYVLAEKFKKYKSVCSSSANFVISQPKSDDLSKGQLKYTIRLKHNY